MQVSIDVGKYPHENTENPDLVAFESGTSVAYAQLAMPRYANKPFDVTRHVLFSDTGMWVKDVATSIGDFEGSIGPAWQLHQVYGAKGENWVNAAHPAIANAYIWDPKYLMHWLNRPQDMLVYLHSSTDATMVLDDVTLDTSRSVGKDLQNNFSTRAWNKLDGSFSPGSTYQFHSFLMPHMPSDNATNLVENISFLVDSDKMTIIKISDVESRRVELLGINTSQSRITVPGYNIETDATALRVIFNAGEIDGYWLTGATYLNIGERVLLSVNTPTTAEHLGSINIAQNSNLNDNVASWQGLWESVAKHGMVSREENDTPDNSGGALRGVINSTDGGRCQHTFRLNASFKQQVSCQPLAGFH